MALNAVLEPQYLFPRLVLWVAIFAAALADAIRHRNVKVAGYQLQRGIILVLGAQIIQDSLLVAYSFTLHNGAASTIFLVYIFFLDFSDALFIGLLLFIAAGWCITRTTLGPYKTKVLLVPTVYLLTSLVVDYTYNAVKGRDEFDAGQDPTLTLDDNLSSLGFLIVNICVVVQLMALFFAWIYIFEIVQKERETLENPQEGIVGAREISDEVLAAIHGQRLHSAEGGGINGAAGREGANVGHHVDLPAEVALDANAPLGDLYAEVTGNDTDQPKTVADRVADDKKARLLRRFNLGVMAYMVSWFVATLLPLFLYSPGQEDTAVRVMLILENLARWAFLAVLCWVFRIREDSPYLLLGDEEGGGPGQAGELETELGVLPSEQESPRTLLYGGPNSSDPRHMDDGTIDDRFDLGDDEDDDLDSASGRPQAAGAPARTPASKEAEKANGKGTPRKLGDPNKPSDATTVDIPLD